jgi:hypothetical protein
MMPLEKTNGFAIFIIAVGIFIFSSANVSVVAES